MKITCLLPTYNRYPEQIYLVNEAVNSFLIQNYEDKELIICNDTPGQFLHFSHPSVKVLNVPDRFESLTHKLRFMIAHAEGDAFCRWDDDDISMPWRLSFSVMKMADKDEWRCENHYFWNVNRIVKMTEFPGNSHNMSIWSRKVLGKFGNGYPMHLHAMGDEDQVFNRTLVRLGYPLNGEVINPKMMFYIYRWNISHNHLSLNKNEWNRIGDKPIVAGDVVLEPRWQQNYVKLAIEFLKASNL